MDGPAALRRTDDERPPRWWSPRAAAALCSREGSFEYSRLVAPALFVAGLFAYWLIYHLQLPYGPPVRSDGEGYYAYLPAYLIYGDPSLASVVREHFLPTYAHTGFTPSDFGLTLQSTGSWLDKYEIGEALLLVPIFLIGHVIALVHDGAAATGYTHPEVYAVGTGGLVYAVLGILALRAVLRRWFSDGVTAATLVVIILGTGLFHYATYDSIFSHAFAFGAVSVTLLCALRWFERPDSWWRAAGFGLAAGTVVVVRIPDLVILPGVLLLGVGSVAALRARVRLLARDHAARSALALGCSAVPMVPQVLTWWVATGYLIVQPYVGESFHFAHPHLLAALFSFYPHGLFPYAPSLLLAVIGVGIAWWRRREMALPVTVAFLPFWYVMSSWWDWSFSDGFGDRIFVDILPLLALPLAVFFASLRPGWLRRGAAALTGVLVLVTISLMVAYWRGALGGAGAPVGEYLRLVIHP